MDPTSLAPQVPFLGNGGMLQAYMQQLAPYLQRTGAQGQPGQGQPGQPMQPGQGSAQGASQVPYQAVGGPTNFAAPSIGGGNLSDILSAFLRGQGARNGMGAPGAGSNMGTAGGTAGPFAAMGGGVY